jgi:hypothetical protein
MWCRASQDQTEQACQSGLSSSNIVTNPIMGAPPSWPHLTLLTPKTPPLNTINIWIRGLNFQHMNFEGHTQAIAARRKEHTCLSPAICSPRWALSPTFFLPSHQGAQVAAETPAPRGALPPSILSPNLTFLINTNLSVNHGWPPICSKKVNICWITMWRLKC